MPNDFLISVICTTYNRPDALSAVVEGLIQQTDTNFEVIIADDGSKQTTQTLISRLQSQTPFRLEHAWQEDLGFRAAAARNLAFTQSHGEYILLLDGDCIPSPNWVRNHRLLAERHWTVPGQRILTSQAFCAEILNQHHPFSDWSPGNFRKLSQCGKVNRWTPACSFGISSLAFWRKWKPFNWKKARSCNWGLWRSDWINVHGFNELMTGWGHEDADLAIRLMRSGVKFKSGSFATAVLHLWHKEAPRENAKHNWELATAQLKSNH